MLDGMSYPICPQCSFSHPPIPAGSRCPMAKEKTPSGSTINFNEFFKSLQNILTSQIQNKNIEDPGKLFGKIIVEITKIAEEYKQ